MDLGSVFVAFLMAGLIKPTVMIVGLLLVVRLGRSLWPRPGRTPWLVIPADDHGDVRVLWWSLAVFFASECMCGVEVYGIGRSSGTFSALHASVSAAGMGIFGLAFARFLDHKLLRFAEPRCAANRICRGCTVQTPAGCKMRGMLQLVLFFGAFTALAPLWASTESIAVDTSRYELPFTGWNAWYDATIVPWLFAHVPGYEPHAATYPMQASELIVEYRVVPLLALALVLVAFGLVRAGQEARGVRVAAVGLGMLSYSILEVVLYDVTGDVILGSLGHEVAELWFVIFVRALLLRTYARGAAAEAEPARAMEAAA